MIYMRYGTYAGTRQVTVSNAPGLTIAGGYAGTTPEPGNMTNVPSVLTRALNVTNRIFLASGSTVTLARVTLDNGYLYITNNSMTQMGTGLFLTNCNALLTNCIISRNSLGGTAGDISYKGGGLYAVSGRLEVVDCSFVSNSIVPTYSGRPPYPYGGALACVGVTSVLTRCLFLGNSMTYGYWATYGGAVSLVNGQASLVDCVFRSNSISQLSGTPYGGALHASGVNPLTVDNCQFFTNYTYATSVNNPAGGALYLEGAAQRAVLRKCALLGNGLANSGAVGEVYLLSGNLFMTNTLVARSRGSSGVRVAGGAALLVNCTFADNAGWGITNAGGVVTGRNCVAWGNGSGGVGKALTATLPVFTYSCAQESLAGLGNFSSNPLFADTNYYHVLSRAGYYAGGLFSGGLWTNSTDTTSPTIDAGDPANPWQSEPQPNRHRVNIGYDANTPVAAMSVLGDPAVFTNLTVYSYPPTNRGATTAWVNGEVAHAGGAENPDVFFVWGPADMGTVSLDDWAHVQPMGAQAPWQIFTTNLTGVSGTTYYRCYVTNSTGSDWSAPAESFVTVSPPVVTNTGASRIARHTALLNGATLDTGGETPSIWVDYWVAGSASTSTAALGPQAGLFTAPVTGLMAGSNYLYRIRASNGAGTVSSPTAEFTTLTTAPLARYVTPTGAGAADGTGWDNASSNIQDVINDCLYAGDSVYLKYGVYTNTYAQMITFSNAAGMTIQGEYLGSGAPGDRTNAPSVVTRDPTVPLRLLRAVASTVTLDRVTLQNGYLNETAAQGAGAWFSNCRVLMTNCTLRANGMTGPGQNTFSGGAIYAAGGSLELADCLLISNRLDQAGDNAFNYGGAIYCNAVTTRLARCVFDHNYVAAPYHSSYGGAIEMLGGQASLSDCRFLTNYIAMNATHTTTYPYGGTLHANGLTTLTIDDCTFAGSYSQAGSTKAGLMYLTGAGQKTVIRRCVMVDNGIAGHSGEIYLDSGTLSMTNVLGARTAYGSALRVAGGAAAVVNCTFADNAAWGVQNVSGAVTARNGIAWGNVAGGLSNCTATYTYSQEVLPGTGNANTDPLFADSVYYHLKSRAANYAGGYFSGGYWMASTANSPAIDAGDAAPFDQEPMPNGGRVNLGAYGNTVAASKTYANQGALIYLR